MSRKSIILLWAAAVVTAAVLCAANLWYGDLNQDEGWYLYAAGEAAAGRMPFVDFASTQGPVMTYFYILALPLVKVMGIAGGRLFTAFLGFICAVLAARLASACSSKFKREASLLTFILISVNVFQSYFFTIVKTYALAGSLLVVSFLLLEKALRRGGFAVAASAGAAAALATATRVSAGAVLPAVVSLLLLYAWLDSRKKLTATGEFRTAVGFGAGFVLTLVLVMVPFVLKSPEGVIFGMFEYHAGRNTGGLIKVLAYKGGFLSRVVRAYLPAISLCAIFILLSIGNRKLVRVCFSSRIRTLILFASLGITAVHFAAPFPYDDYQVPVYPLLAVWVGSGITAFLSLSDLYGRHIRTVVISILAICMLQAFSSTINEGWFIGERDRIWWPMKEKSPLAVLRETAARISAGNNGETLLTQDPYLAVETGMKLPEGLELGPFSFFPKFTDEEAGARKVVNKSLFIELMKESSADIAAFSGYSFAIASPGIEEMDPEDRAELLAVLESGYSLDYTVSPFGQASTELKVYRRKK